MAFDRPAPLNPAPSLLPPRAPAFQRADHERQSNNALRGQEEVVDKIARSFEQYTDTPITVNGETFYVLARRARNVGNDAETATSEPWQCSKVDGLVIRVYPSAIADGGGAREWPTFNDLPSGPETFFDIPLPPSPLSGWVYLEIQVDDTNDYHGQIVSAKLLAGEAPPEGFQTKVGTKVYLDICGYQINPDGTLGLDPRRAFVFTLRRYGPPGSFTWDAEIS